jgi:hypothetical protein
MESNLSYSGCCAVQFPLLPLGASPAGNSLLNYPLDYGNNYSSPYGGLTIHYLRVFNEQAL